MHSSLLTYGGMLADRRIFDYGARVVGGCCDNMFSSTRLKKDQFSTNHFKRIYVHSEFLNWVGKDPYIPQCMFNTFCRIHHSMLFLCKKTTFFLC